MSPSLLRWQLVLWTAINGRLFFFHQGFMSGLGRSGSSARDQQGGHGKKKKKVCEDRSTAFSGGNLADIQRSCCFGEVYDSVLQFTSAYVKQWRETLLSSRCKTFPKISLFSFPAQNNTSLSDDWRKENNLFLSLNILKAVIVQFAAMNFNEFGNNRIFSLSYLNLHLE